MDGCSSGFVPIYYGCVVSLGLGNDGGDYRGGYAIDWTEASGASTSRSKHSLHEERSFMPNVEGKEFPYTKAGYAAAKKAAAKVALKKKAKPKAKTKKKK